jgi:hypothetical protein
LIVSSCCDLGGDQFADNLDSVSLDESGKICRSVEVADVFEGLGDSQAPAIPDAPYCSGCHRDDLRWFSPWGVKNGRTKRDFPFLALIGEARVVVGQGKREKDHHEYSDSGKMGEIRVAAEFISPAKR